MSDGRHFAKNLKLDIETIEASAPALDKYKPGTCRSLARDRRKARQPNKSTAWYECSRGMRHELRFVAPGHPIFVAGDAVRLTQVFCNLMNNAAKYTPQGGRIALQVARSEGQVTISVRDNGIGID